MRQLAIIAFLLILVAIGTYYLIVQRVDLNLYYPPTSAQFPQNHGPRPLASITPGPAFHNEFSWGPNHTPAPATPAAHQTFKRTPTLLRSTPWPATAPTTSVVTPMPAPTFVVATPPGMPHTPPPINAHPLLPGSVPTATVSPFEHRSPEPERSAAPTRTPLPLGTPGSPRPNATP